MYHYSLDHIRELRQLIDRYGLSAPPEFFQADDAFLQSAYNGIGPESWCPVFRNLTSFLLQFFEADALIHDFEYSGKAKSYSHFTQANLRFAWNAANLAFSRIGSLQKAVKVAALGLLLALLCQLFGYEGYTTVQTGEEEK